VPFEFATPPFVVKPKLSGEPSRESTAELAHPSPSRTAALSLFFSTTSSASSPFATADALLDELRRTIGPFNSQDVRRRSLVSPLEQIHFPFTVAVGSGREFISSFSFVFLSFVGNQFLVSLQT
jgi:hypothetical protein